MHTKSMISDNLQISLKNQPSAASLRCDFGTLKRDFARIGRLDQLYDYLWNHRAVVFERLDTIADFVGLAAELDRLDEVLDEFYSKQKSGELHHLPWDINFVPAQSKGIDRNFANSLLSLKYQDISTDIEKRESALKLMRSRIIIDTDLINALFDVRIDKKTSFEHWYSEIYNTFALEHMIYDTLGGGLRIKLSEFIDYSEFKKLGEISDGKPALIVIYHGGFVQVLKRGYDIAFPEGYRIQSGRSTNERQLSISDKSGALFLALRALTEGHSVLMTPDLWTGESNLSMEILGQRYKVAKGAPFLAYEAGCRVFWFDVVRTGARLKPRLIHLIQRKTDERYKEFCTRFYDAYSAMINAALRGAPENIVLRRQWARYVAQAGMLQVE